jgi:transcriptional regulator GlxA family with amidase domain
MHRIGYIVPADFQVMLFASLSVFEFANLSEGGPYYDVHMLSERGGAVPSTFGASVATEALSSAAFDTVMVGASITPPSATPRVRQFLQDALASARRIASTCTGAFILAEAGLLDERRATTHWAYARELQTRFPRVKVDPDRIFIVDGAVWTSAGMSSGIDLALGMVESDLGAETARLIAKNLVLYHRRAGGQSQHSTLLELGAKSDRIQSALSFAKQNLRTSLSVERLADAAHLSPRQFSRSFRAETGQSPAKAVENLRVEAAKLMMEQSRHPIDTVAAETGFADRERMRRAFLRAFGQPPQVIRRNAQIRSRA